MRKLTFIFFELFSEIGFEILFSRALSSLQFCNVAGWFFPCVSTHTIGGVSLHLNTNQKKTGGCRVATCPCAILNPSCCPRAQETLHHHFG